MRSGSLRLTRSSMRCTCSQARRWRSRCIKPSPSSRQTYSLVGVMLSAGTSRPKLSSEKRSRYWPVLALKPTKPCNWSAAWQIWVDVILMANLCFCGFAGKAEGSVYPRSLAPGAGIRRCRGSIKSLQGGQHLVAQQGRQVVGQGLAEVQPAQLLQFGSRRHGMRQGGAKEVRLQPGIGLVGGGRLVLAEGV